MKKFVLLAGIAAMVAMPATANANGRGGWGSDDDNNITTSFDESVSVDVEYDNYLNASIDVDVEYDKKLALFGGAAVRGFINVNSSAVAVSDPKQIVETNTVNSNTSNGNTSTIGTVDGKGNIGVNSAAGNANQQANVASIASAPGGGANDYDSKSKDGHRDGNAGWAEATTVSLQKVLGNSYYGGGSNRSDIADVKGNGNIGVNSVAGAFNTQQNVLTMAVVKDGALAEANSGLLQVTYDNTINAAAGTNSSNIGHVGGEGNIGVNSAAGVGNVQANILTIASSSH